ncbi:MAG: hypothetical protein FWC77_00805 [Defluviitaleaceae bacterium]|nr:hypothetical protein [Defluviitaleaceae bacterium]
MKVVIIGGGSYVFVPTVIEDLIIKSKLNCHITLVDLNLEAVNLLAEITKQIAADHGVAVDVSATSDRVAALANADYVINTAAIQGFKRWQMDYDICKDEGIPFELRECGALSGIAYGIRTITLLLDICKDMGKLCPSAKLFNVSNPLTKVHEAIHRFTNIESYGFCSVAQCGADGYERIAQTLGLHHTEIDVVSAGLNHFSWIVSINDRASGEDLLPAYLEILRNSADRDSRLRLRWYMEYDAIPALYADHFAEFLPYQPDVHYLYAPPFHGNEAERLQRFEEMRQMAAGKLDYKKVPLFLGHSWEHPGLVAGALTHKTSMHINALNLPNSGCLPQLPDGAIVEVPTKITDGIIQPAKGIMLPEKAANACINQCKVAGMIATAAVQGDEKLALEVVELDRSITEKAAAARALKRILMAHKDILPQFS